MYGVPRTITTPNLRKREYFYKKNIKMPVESFLMADNIYGLLI